MREMGWPSIWAAAEDALPGTLNKIAVIEPMKVAPPVRAPNSSRTEIGSQCSVISKATVAMLVPPMPGRKAETMAISVPSSGIAMFGQLRTWPAPAAMAAR